MTTRTNPKQEPHTKTHPDDLGQHGSECPSKEPNPTHTTNLQSPTTQPTREDSRPTVPNHPGQPTHPSSRKTQQHRSKKQDQQPTRQKTDTTVLLSNGCGILDCQKCQDHNNPHMQSIRPHGLRRRNGSNHNNKQGNICTTG